MLLGSPPNRTGEHQRRSPIKTPKPMEASFLKSPSLRPPVSPLFLFKWKFFKKTSFTFVLSFTVLQMELNWTVIPFLSFLCIRERVEGQGSIFYSLFDQWWHAPREGKGLKREEERALNMREKGKGLSSKRAAKRRERREESNPSYWMVCITT